MLNVASAEGFRQDQEFSNMRGHRSVYESKSIKTSHNNWAEAESTNLFIHIM